MLLRTWRRVGGREGTRAAGIHSRWYYEHRWGWMVEGLGVASMSWFLSDFGLGQNYGVSGDCSKHHHGDAWVVVNRSMVHSEGHPT